MSTIKLGSPIGSLPGIGPKTEKLLSKLDLYTIGDLIRFFPIRHLDFTHTTPINNLKVNHLACFQASIDQPKSFFTRSGKLITTATASDNSGQISLTWFNAPYLSKTIKPGEVYSLCGKANYFAGKLTLIAPTVELGSLKTIHSHGLVPIYPQTAGITSRWLRQKIDQLLTELDSPDPLLSSTLKSQKLIDLKSAYQQIHFPKTTDDHNQADERLAFNQHLLINLRNLLELQQLPPSPALNINTSVHQQALDRLPFQLTPTQIETISHLYQDLTTTNFSHRLIMGETGSGKTVTLVMAANQCLANNLSFVLMAPTQILANQHADTFRQLSLYPDSVVLVAANQKLKAPPEKPTIFIGTHALINQLPETIAPVIAMVAIDEQHKFGVDQRQALLNRQPTPHLVNLSATPIPRTVALGLFGEIKLSQLKHKPKGKKSVKTWLVTPTRFRDSQPWLESQLKDSQKIFVVCPHIQSSPSNEIKSIEKIYQDYQQRFGARYPILKLHGQMKPEEKQLVITKFRHHSQAILVSTAIIEVGIDIPKANIIIIHSAERFGLAQLHQLRGRVGRHGGQGYCLLVPTSDDEVEIERLQLLTKHHSGLILAKLDLKLRGAGELFGLKQHGYLPTRLKHFWDKKLFHQAKTLAKNLILSQPKSALSLVSALNHC